MKKIIYYINICLFITLTNWNVIYAQEEEVSGIEEGIEEEIEESSWRIGFAVLHTYISTETTEGRENLILPSLGLDIEYWFNEKWGIGMHNDIEIETFEVEKEQGEFIERNFPLVLTVDALWKAWEELVIVVGGGVELEGSESFALLRTGLEYEIEFHEKWDLSPVVTYDFRLDAFDTWSMGIGIGRRF